MAYPIKVCSVCGEEFELKPDKPGFANQCPECTEAEGAERLSKGRKDLVERQSERAVNEARREAMRNLLYRKDS